MGDIRKKSAALKAGFADGDFSSQGAVLDSLRQYVLNRVTDGPDRSHRTKLVSFVAYQTRMTALAGGADPEQAVADQATAEQEGNPASAEPATAPASAGLGLGTWAFWLSVLSLLGLAYLLFTRRQGGNPSANTDKTDARLAGLQDETNRLSSTVAELANRLTLAEKRMAQAGAVNPANRPAPTAPPEPPRRPDTLTERGPVATPAPGSNQPRQGYGNPANPVMPATGTSAPRPAPAEAPAAPVNVPEPVSNVPAAPPAPTKLFARTADLGNGFSISGLMGQAERGIVYEIDLTSPTTATYRVSQSPESQQLAMSDPYSYLSDACLYDNQPGGPNSRIQTVKPGQLMLQGDKWQITEKARIGFV